MKSKGLNRPKILECPFVECMSKIRRSPFRLKFMMSSLRESFSCHSKFHAISEHFKTMLEQCIAT